MRRNNRPRIELWGTVALAQEGTYPFITTLCFWLSEKSFKILTKLPDITFCCKFYKNVIFYKFINFINAI